MVGALLQTDPAVAGAVNVAANKKTLTLSLKVLRCFETQPVEGAPGPVCLDSARAQKAAALAALLPRGVLSQFNVTTAGAKVRVAVFYQGALVPNSLPPGTDPKCSLYRAALAGNALFADVRSARAGGPGARAEPCLLCEPCLLRC